MRSHKLIAGLALATGQHADDVTIISGNDETKYTYTVTLRQTRQ